MVEREKDPFGYIYRATNVVNDKVYIGQTTTSRWNEDKIPIEERWKEEVGEAYRNEARGENLRYIENAIIKYGPENFELTQQDIAYSQEELNKKETEHIRESDSMNPDKGYNLKEGGRGGRLSEQAKENLSNIIKDKYQNDPEYYNKQLSERQERGKDPEFISKMTEINREQAKNPQRNAKLSEIGTSKWQEPEYRRKQTKERKERAKNPQFLEKMREIGKQYRKEIPDKREFLNDIKENMQKKDMLQKYDMGKNSFGKRIQEMFGPGGPKNYTELKQYLQDRNVGDVLKEIEERNKEKEIKPESQGDDIKDKGESKSQDTLKEKTVCFR